MQKYIIGIDLGINNVGWSIVSMEDKKLEKAGVRLFAPADDAQERRSYRGAKRRKKRKDNRIHDLLKVFMQIGFPQNNTVDPELLSKRLRGLKEKIEPQDIVNIVCYIARHRGYIPFGDEERELIDLNGMLPCEYYAKLLQEKGKYRALEEVVDHKDLICEVKTILSTQLKYYPELAHINDNILDIISRKRLFWQGPGSINSLTSYGRFKTEQDVIDYQNSQTEKYLYDELIGKCMIYPNEKVTSIANYYYEEFNLLNDFINTSIVRLDNLQDKANIYIKQDANTGYYKLNALGLNKVIEYCHNNVNVKYDKIYKDLFGLKKEDLAGYRQKKDLSPDFQTLNTYRTIKKAFGDYQNAWLEDINQYNEFIRIISITPGIVESKKMLTTSPIIQVNFTDEEYNIIKDVTAKLKKNNSLRYGSFSEKLLKRAINDMLSYELNYQQVAKKLKYEDEARQALLKRYQDTKGLKLMDKQFIDDIIASPQVKKSLRQAINVINAIIKEKGDYPFVIAVESTKEVNSNERRKEIEKTQREDEKRREEARVLLSTKFGDEYATERNIEKVMAFQELDGRCPYCNKPFKDGLNGIIKSNIEVEHILPLSKSFNNSFANKTLACRECNESKKNNTPYLWMGSTSERFKDFTTRISKLPISDEKKANFLETKDLDKYNTRFFNRNLRDTAYATKELINQINLFNSYIQYQDHTQPKIKTLSTPGQLTGKIRKKLDLGKDRDIGKFHHAVDASIVAGIALDNQLGSLLLESQNDSQFWIKKKNLDNEIGNLIYDFNMDYFYDELKKIKSDDDIMLSEQVIKDPNRSIANANVYKYLKLDKQFYKVEQINDIYDKKLNLKLLEKLFNDKIGRLMIKDNNPKMYNKLKEIFYSYKNAGPIPNPFLNYCLEVNDITDKEFDYRIHGIKPENGPVIKKLRYYSPITTPALLEKKNIQKKANTYIGLDSLSQGYIQIYWDNQENKFIFFPVYVISIDLNTKQLNKEDQTYKTLYDKYLKDKDVTFIVNLYNGNIISVQKSSGKLIKGTISTYNKSTNVISTKNGDIFVTSDKQLKVYDADYLGNEKLRLTWPEK